MVVCARCKTKVTDDVSNPDYKFYCPEHDEDLYSIETLTVCCKCKREHHSGDVRFLTEHDGKGDFLCMDCAEESTNIGEFIDSENGDAWTKCAWCEGLFPENELKKEKDMGYLCDWCVQGILSHGESLCLVYGD